MATAIEVHGLKNLLAELRKYEPTLYKAISTELLSGSQQLVNAVGSDFPSRPLKNWPSSPARLGEARLPAYSSGKARKGVKAVVARKNGILRLEQRDAGGAVYDSAGGANISLFVKNLDKHLKTKSKPPKTRSRVMYSSVRQHIGLVEADILKIIGKTEKMIQTKIVRDS